MQKFIVTAKKAGHQTPDKTHGYQRSEHIFEKKNCIDGICTDSSYMSVVNLNLLKCKMNFNDDLVNRLQPCNAEGMTQTCQTHTYISLEYH